MLLHTGEEVCRRFDEIVRREWLETNGIGGYCSGTLSGIHTRRYHGLLMAATHPPAGRTLLLSKYEEKVRIGDREYSLSSNQYPGTVHPDGHRYLREFRLDPCPVFVYDLDGVTLTKRVWMTPGENTTTVEYSVDSGRARLELRPLIAFRDYHSLTHRNDALDSNVFIGDGAVSVKPYPDLPALRFLHNASLVARTGDWYLNFLYGVESERGLDDREDLFQPFLLEFELARPARVAATCETNPADAGPKPHTDLWDRATDQFLVARGERETVIAGYHWFADWGRDTMIALPGLTLAAGRFGAARDILLEFASHVSEGMLPNRFPEAGEVPEYNTVDATLWFFEAIRAYAAASGDSEMVKRLFPILEDIIEWHVRGTRYGIAMDPDDGLLRCGTESTQLTWMDVKIGDWAVTPRNGKPVEIQALWYNALRFMAGFAPGYSEIAERARSSFREQFWNEASQCLYDVVDAGKDASIRPNQIFAVSLEHPLLEGGQARSVVEAVERELLTPFGLRTLSPADPRYRPVYAGPPRERDSAYHQGTVWPWLIGPFCRAYLKVHGHSSEAKAQAAKWIEPLRQHMREDCAGQIAEIFDAAPPHHARGCAAQAWSVAEVYRVWKAINP